MKKAKKTLFSVLLVTAILMSTLSSGLFAYAAETCTIQLSCSPQGRVERGDDVVVVSTQGTIEAQQGDSITLTAVPLSGYSFLYWLNMETNRVFSYSAEYTFSVATYLNLQAVFCDNTDDEWNYVTYLQFSHNVLFSFEYQVGDSNSISEQLANYTPTRDGYVWTGEWSKTVEQVAISTTPVLVYPVFEIDEAITYSVTAMVDGVQQSYNEYSYLGLATVTAPATLNGQAFSYWYIEGLDDAPDEIVSYYLTYSFYVTANVVLIAVYGSDNNTGIATRIVGDSPHFDEFSITFYAERSISTRYNVLQHGLLLTYDDRTGRNDSSFIIDPTNSNIIKATASETAKSGTYIVTKTNWKLQKEFLGIQQWVFPRTYVRSYVILSDAQGNVLDTVYSSVYTVDYESFSHSGDIDWGDNVPDPFAT